MIQTTRKLSMRMAATMALLLTCLNFTQAQDKVSASVNTSNRTASLSNGIVNLTINSKGQVNLLEHQGTDLLNASGGGRLYFSYNDQNAYSELSPDAIRLEKQTDDYAEVVYSRTSGDLLLEQGFILRKGVSGLYMYVVVKGTAADIRLREMRVVYRVDPDAFDYGFITNEMQGLMPSVSVMKSVESDPIMDATYQLPDGSVYTKYNWANYVDRDSVHGIMSDSNGLWAMAVSNEYLNGGPMKQELTVHATGKTPLVLQMLQGEHFGASSQTYQAGDEKIYGPFFVYLNSGNSHEEMIADAQAQAAVQKEQWPYSWFSHSLYPTQRTTVTGRIKLPSAYAATQLKVALAQPGSDMYEQGKDYLFWSETDNEGNFTIEHVREGSYSLYAYALDGEITDEFEKENIEVVGSSLDLGEISWIPTKYDHLLWQIGSNNRLADGFRYSDTLRNYGLYELPPANLNYTIGSSSPDKDWYYAQTKVGVWTVTFTNNESLSGNATLTASIAGAANSPRVAVSVNGHFLGTWTFSNDASVYRSAVLGGKHSLRTFTFPASYLVQGENTVKLSMSNVGNRGGVMYDCLKLEAGDITTASDKLLSANNDLQLTIYPNPFVNQLRFEFEIPAADAISVRLYNLEGQVVKMIPEQQYPAGQHQLECTTEELLPGTYFYQFNSKFGLRSGKLIKTE